MAGPSAPRPFAVAGSAYPHQYKSFLSQGHPPLSRSAYEPGSRSQGLWSDVNRGEFHPIPPAQHDASRTQPDVFGGMQVSMQAHHRRQSASSMDDDVEDDSQSAGRNDDRRSAWSSEDEENVATRMRRDTTGSTTSMRVGFASLLNPVAASVDGQDP